MSAIALHALWFVLGLLLSNGSEWVIHKYVLHGLGRNKKSFWSFHWHDHHRQCRQHDMVDVGYRRRLFRSLDPQTREVLGLLLGALTTFPLVLWIPAFVAAAWLSAFCYYLAHRRAHLDPTWARAHLPWHYDHHMGKNQEANWCVTFPLFDWILRTRLVDDRATQRED